MYLEGIAFLAENGYAQYEISNFARTGYESRHNLKYWNCDEYLGFGVAAYSDFGGTRFGNSRDIEEYIKGHDITEESTTPDREERMNEYVMLRFRLCEGIDTAVFESRFGASFEEMYGCKDYSLFSVPGRSVCCIGAGQAGGRQVFSFARGNACQQRDLIRHFGFCIAKIKNHLTSARISCTIMTHTIIEKRGNRHERKRTRIFYAGR